MHIEFHTALAIVVIIIIILTCPSLAIVAMGVYFALIYLAPHDAHRGSTKYINPDRTEVRKKYMGSFDVDQPLDVAVDMDIYANPSVGPYNCDRFGEDDGELDGDEKISKQSTSRNDLTRAIAGTMKRRENMDKYFREELDEEEATVWWGAHEV